MATNPLLLSIREAVRLNKELSRLFDQVGNASKPRGAIVSAYRVALRALRADTSPNAVRDVMRNLRNQVEREARQLLLDASAIGHKSAITQSGYYQQRVTPPPPNLERIEQQVVSIGDQVQAQASAAVGLALMEREEELIVGTDSRAGGGPSDADRERVGYRAGVVAGRGVFVGHGRGATDGLLETGHRRAGCRPAKPRPSRSSNPHIRFRH